MTATEDTVAETMTVVITLGVTDGGFDAGWIGAFSLVGGTMSARVVMRVEPTLLARGGGGSTGGGGKGGGNGGGGNGKASNSSLGYSTIVG